MKKYFYLIILLLSFYPLTINAQWYWQNPKPQGNTIEYFTLSEDSSLIILTNTSILSSTDNGQTWVEKLFPEEFNPSTFSRNNDSLWVVTWTPSSEYFLYVSTDWGQNWVNISQLPCVVST